MNKVIEMVVLLNGAFCPIQLVENQKEKFSKMLIEVVNKSANDPTAYVKFGDTILIAKSIVGWYFRELTVSPNKEIIDLLKKNLPSEDGSESWKG